MPQPVLTLVALAVVAACVFARLRWAAAALIATVFLIPDALVVPGTVHSLTVLRAAIFATTAGLVWRAARGAIPWSALRPGRVHAVLGTYVAFAYFDGVAGAVPPAAFSPGLHLWFSSVDQLLFLWCAIALVRELGVRWVAGCTVTVLFVSAVIAGGEWATGHSYAHYWFEHVPNPPLGPADYLEHRGSAVRVRAASEFSLEFAWVMAVFLPLTVAFALNARKRAFAAVVPAVMVFAIVETVSRSPLVGLVIGMIVMVAAARLEPRALALLLLAGVAAVVVYAGVPSLRHPYRAAAATDSITSHDRRLTLVAGATAPHPLTGIGFDGPSASRGVTSTDDSYLFAYASVGAIGLILLVSAVVVPIASGAAAGLADPGKDRLFPAAAAGGLVTAMVSAAAYDSLVVPEAAVGVWLLAALAVGALERTPVPSWGRPSRTRVVLPLVGVLAGVAVLAMSPYRFSTTARISVLSPAVAAIPADSTYPGAIQVAAVCRAGGGALHGSGVSVQCYPDSSGPGMGRLRVEGPAAATVASALGRFDRAASAVDAPYLRADATETGGRRSAARVAPVLGGLCGVLLALLLPGLPDRRRIRAALALAA